TLKAGAEKEKSQKKLYSRLDQEKEKIKDSEKIYLASLSTEIPRDM
ncbi:28438_t:CDS:1, partial [Dentiscutata erythropus]